MFLRIRSTINKSHLGKIEGSSVTLLDCRIGEFNSDNLEIVNKVGDRLVKLSSSELPRSYQKLSKILSVEVRVLDFQESSDRYALEINLECE